MSQFSCDRCGICCKFLTNNKEARAAGLDRGDGVCKHLTADNLCDIYDSRPLMCRVDESWEKFHSHEMTREEYHRLQKSACVFLKKAFKEFDKCAKK